MAYLRVIPRDLFNEANLLKCLGQLCLQPGIELIHDGGAFDIQQSPDDGSLRVCNVQLQTGDVLYSLWRPLNSRDPWPLYVSDDIAVFDDTGNLSPEFLSFIGA